MRSELTSRTRSAGTRVVPTVHTADRRDGSKLGRPSTSTVSVLSSTTHRTPSGPPSSKWTGTSTALTTAPFGTGRMMPWTRRAPSLSDRPRRPAGAIADPSAEPVGTSNDIGVVPSARPGSKALACSAVAHSASTAPATIVVDQGPGAAAFPSSSATTASSNSPAPWPPNSSGRWIPSVPWAARSSQKGGRLSSAASSAARVTAGGQRDSIHRSMEARSSSCSSRMPMAIDQFLHLRMSPRPDRTDRPVGPDGTQPSDIRGAASVDGVGITREFLASDQAVTRTGSRTPDRWSAPARRRSAAAPPGPTSP